MHRHVSTPASLFSLALALGACAEPGPLPDDIALDSAAIIGGTRSSAAQNAVVLLDIGGEALCTGTLVAPNLVLTARHCVSQTDEGLLCAPSGRPLEGGGVGADYDAQDITVYTGQRQATLHAAARGAQLVHDSARNLCNHDIAFVVLDRDVTGVPIAALRTRDTTRVGERVTSVGWGLTRRGVIPSARMQRRNVAVLDVGPSQYSAPTDLLVDLQRRQRRPGALRQRRGDRRGLARRQRRVRPRRASLGLHRARHRERLHARRAVQAPGRDGVS